MICKKCNGKIVDGCCTKCGILENGNRIEEINVDKNEDLKLLNEEFEVISENKNIGLIFLLGPLYFSYRGYFFLGTLLGIIDFFIFCNFFKTSIFVILFGWVMCGLIYILINRLIYIIFANYICLSMDKLKVKNIKKKYKENYKEKLIEYKHKKHYLIFTILIYIILILSFIIYKRIENGLF